MYIESTILCITCKWNPLNWRWKRINFEPVSPYCSSSSSLSLSWWWWWCNNVLWLRRTPVIPRKRFLKWQLSLSLSVGKVSSVACRSTSILLRHHLPSPFSRRSDTLSDPSLSTGLSNCVMGLKPQNYSHLMTCDTWYLRNIDETQVWGPNVIITFFTVLHNNLYTYIFSNDKGRVFRGAWGKSAVRGRCGTTWIVVRAKLATESFPILLLSVYLLTPAFLK